MKVLCVNPGLSPVLCDIDNSLRAMQEMVGGLIEIYKPTSHDDDALIVCNKEGKINGMPLNRLVFTDEGEICDIIAGPFFICRAPADSENFESLTEEQIIRYAEMYA